MRIDYQASLFATETHSMLPSARRRQETLNASLKSLGSSQDLVSISEEARQKAAEAAAQKALSASGGADGEGAKEPEDAAGVFSAYMKEKTGKTSTQESIEGIRKKIQSLKQRAISITSSKSISESVKQSQLSAIESEINALMEKLEQMIAAATQ